MASSIVEYSIQSSPSSSSDDMLSSLSDCCSDDCMSSDEEELVDFILTGCTDEDDEVEYFPSQDTADRFIGILIFMSLVRCHSIAAYWSDSPVYKNFVITKVMSRNRFQAILSFLQITPQADIDKDDKLTRVRPLLDHVRNRSQELFQPYEYISGDERILASKHQYSGIRQYCKDKPVKFGLKIFVLACSLTGYTFDFFIYLGKKRTLFVNSTHGLTYNVIMSLVSSVSHQGYKLFYDRYFTTKQLIIDLLKIGIYSVGPIKNNNSAMPFVFRDVLRWGKISCRGDFRWERDTSKKFVVVQWRDSKVVSIVSAYHSGSDITKCVRTIKDRTGWKHKELLQPQVIHDYNQYMGGVDKSDQYLNKFPCYIRSQFHWWKVLFFHLIDIMVVNSFILMKEYVTKFPDDFALPVKFGQGEFRECLVISLLGTDFVDFDNFKLCMPEFSESRNRCHYCYAKSKIESKSDVVDVKTFVYCKNCNVFLCLQKNRNCFSHWHLPLNINIRNWVGKNCRKRTVDGN